MSYFIFDQEEHVDVFKYTRFIERIGRLRRVAGWSFPKTRDLGPAAMKLLFERDIRQAVNDKKLPEMIFTIIVDTQTPVPLYRIIIHHVAAPLVLRPADLSEEEINCEDSSIGRVQLTDLAHYVRDKIMQILWRYNADVITVGAIYGRTHFTYQVAFSPLLIERQVRSFDIARQRIVARHEQESASLEAA